MILKRWFLPLLTLCVANAHAQAVNGVILNQQYLDVCSGPHAYLIATLPASNAGTYDHLHLVATFGSNWDSTGNSTINATFANRQSFSYAYTAMGSSPTGNGSHITAYQQNDGTADPNNPYTGGSINLYFMINGCTTASYTVLENLQENVYGSPVDSLGATPAGNLVFDTTLPAYAPANYTDFAGDFSTNGSLGVGTVSPISPLTVTKDSSIQLPSQLTIQGATNGSQQLVLGYNTTSDFAAIQSIKQGTAEEPLLLNPFGGAIGVGLGNSVMPTAGTELEVNGAIKMDGSGVLTFPDGSSMSSAKFLGVGQGQAGTPLAPSSLPTDIVLTDSQTPQTIANQVAFSGDVSIGTSSSPTALILQGVNGGIGLMTLGTALANAGNKGWNIRANYDGGPFNGQADSLGYEYWNGVNEISPLTLLPSGNIGIGTTTPGATLEVNGNIKLTAGTGASITFPDGTIQSTAFGPSNCSTGGPQLGPATAPSGSCSTNGAWVFSQDGHATFCASGTWTTKI